MSRRSSGSPDRRESRSPVTQTSSARRPADHATASSTAGRPAPDRVPRWKSDRWWIRSRRGRAAGQDGHVEHTQPRPAGLATSPRPRRRLPRAAPTDRPWRRPAVKTWIFSSTGSTETTCRLKRELRLLEPGRDADQLREVEDRHRKSLPVSPSASTARRRATGGRAGTASRSRPRRPPSPARSADQLAERRLLARLDDREAAALDLRRVVDRLAAARLDDPLERPGPVGSSKPRASTAAGSGSRRTARS
jgi:hypothetical protein